MANNILKYKGMKLENLFKKIIVIKLLKKYFLYQKKKTCKIIYPEDVAVGKDLNGSAEIKELNNISKDELILDIGPKTIKAINLLIEESSTILWNGPAGYFENPKLC